MKPTITCSFIGTSPLGGRSSTIETISNGRRIATQTENAWPMVTICKPNRKMFYSRWNWSDIRILSLWDLYFCSVRHYSVVHIFFSFEKYQVSVQNPKAVLSKNVYSWWKLARNSNFIFVRPIFFSQSDITMLYIIFFEILKNIEFRFKKQRGYPSILPKNICSRWKHVENSYFIPVRPIFLLC
jgi:hypothetical protein